MRAVLTRAGIVCILIGGCGSGGTGLETGTGGEIGVGMGGSAGTGSPNGSVGGTVGGAGGTPAVVGGTTGGGTTGSGGMTTTAGAGGTTTTTGAGGATTATGTGGAAATPSTGALVPLYTVPSDPSWGALAAAKTAHLKVPVYAIIDPANGPGAVADAGYTAGIDKLELAGVTVIGYVPTGYAARSAAAIQADIDRWKSFYPRIQGIFFDEMSARMGDEMLYRTVSQYAKSKGMTFTVGNPGIDTKPTFVGTTDVIMIYESAGLPPTSALSGWHTSYPRTSFGVFAYGVATLDHALIKEARNYVGYIYVNTDVLPNPWDSVPSYLGALFADLE